MNSGMIALAFFTTGIFTLSATAQTPQTEPGKTAERPPIRVILTAKDTPNRLTAQQPVAWTVSDLPAAESSAAITLDPAESFQTITGFGGAFTESAAYALSKVSPEKRTEAIRAYFDPKDGIGYTLCRTHINSCDFSLDNYAYAEVEGDTELKHFDISRDRKLLIPLIKDAMAVPGARFKLLASPWSPPAWMKTNGDMNHGSQLKPEYRPAWALYYAKYIKAYREEGIEIWAITVQNEPAAVQTWDSCIWSAEEEGQFVRDHLGPTLRSQGLETIKVLVWDHNKDIIFERVEPILSDPRTAAYVWGVGFHWYSGDQFENLDKVHRAFPEKHLLFTEGCQEGGVHPGSWALGERYAHDIIGDMNNWTVGWIDWNMVLDQRGGPNHVGNFCDAPIIADAEKNSLMYQSSYYYLGHFSKFIRPGAVRIGCAVKNSPLEVTAFKNEDGSIAVPIMNRTDKAVSAEVELGDLHAVIQSPAHSMLTLLL
jgi:glucosylceramidase